MKIHAYVRMHVPQIKHINTLKDFYYSLMTARPGNKSYKITLDDLCVNNKKFILLHCIPIFMYFDKIFI